MVGLIKCSKVNLVDLTQAVGGPSILENYDFKLEKIVSTCGEILGYEILLDFGKAKSKSESLFARYKKAISDASAIECLVQKLETSNLVVSDAKRLFLNFERMHLCHKTLLKKIVQLSKSLIEKGIELVLEITERKTCGQCPHITSGLNFLKKSGVTLAADDFDIYGIDFRLAEVSAGLYEYIKIELPTNCFQRKLFNDFSSSSSCIGKRLIIERVEDPDMLRGLSIPFGLQGYAFGVSTPAEFINA